MQDTSFYPAPVLSPMYLADLHHDDHYEGFLLVRSAEVRTAQSGKAYIDMNLADGSGSISAKCWDGSQPPPPKGSIIKVRGAGNLFRGTMQLRVDRFRPAEKQDNVDMSMLMPCAPEAPEKMMEEIVRAADQIKDADYRKITCRMLDKAGDVLLTFPAAIQMHHAERGGLLHHTLTMLRSARALITVYPYLNQDLLTAGVIIHDLGKIDEMQQDSVGLVSDYTTDGKLIGHIIRGAINIEEAAKETKASMEKARILQHMMLSHHGIPEYGSPRMPMFPEAEVLHTIDTLDAHLFQMVEAQKRAVPGGFSDKVFGLDNRQIYRLPEDS